MNLAGDLGAGIQHARDDGGVEIGNVAFSVDEPFIIGTPASMMLSFSATVLPLSLPLAAPLTVALRYQALRGFSSGAGR